MTNPEVLRWGVLGTANIGRAAVNPAIQASRNGELVAVASRDGERARDFASRHGIPRSHGSYQALLDDPGVDAVYIPLPNALHREWTIRAARAGKHILCEKPLAMTSAEALEMEAAAEHHGVRLMEAFMYRFHPRTERLLELVRQGAVGEIQALRSSFTFRVTNPANIRLDPSLGGGALMDVGCYCVNVSRTLAGREPVEVRALARWGDSGVDLAVAGVLRFPQDLLATFDCALTLDRRESCEAAGTGGTLRVDPAFLPGTGDVEIQEIRGRGEGKVHPIPGVDQYQRMVEHFADAVLTGAPLRYPAAEAAANLRVIEALYRSARGGGRGVEV
jgi:D-xylose 1-dehydrogenase (NADP+, D-xylono-1,5-lactone-forming)